MDSLLESMSSSGASPMSVSLCPFLLKCCAVLHRWSCFVWLYDALQICHVVSVLFQSDIFC